MARQLGTTAGTGNLTEWEAKRVDKQLPGEVRTKLKNKIEKSKRKHESTSRHGYSSETIGEIRTHFFKAIVELFSGYKMCIGQDDDGNTVFDIQKFSQFRPTEYKEFYQAFFQYQPVNLEHFGFMEFLNLQHSGERDSELAQKKENFDNHVLIENERKHAKKEKQLK